MAKTGKKEDGEPAPPDWDKFKELTDDIEEAHEEYWGKVFLVTKIIFAVFLSICVLGSAVLSKTTMLILVANIAPPSFNISNPLKTAKGVLQYNATSQVSVTNVNYIWALFIITIAPYVLGTLSNVWKMLFGKASSKRRKRSKQNQQNHDKKTINDSHTLRVPLLVVFVLETVHSIGLNLFVFVVLPTLDPFSGAMYCTSVILLPAALNIFYPGSQFKKRNKVNGIPEVEKKGKVSRNKTTTAELEERICLKRTFPVITLITSLGSTILWTINIRVVDSEKNVGMFVLVVITPILISAGWVTNFLSKPDTPPQDTDAKGITGVVAGIRKHRIKIYSLVYFWKTILVLIMVTLIHSIDCSSGFDCLKSLYGSFEMGNLTSGLFALPQFLSNLEPATCSHRLPYYLALINITSSMFCYLCCKAANKILARLLSFSLPLILAPTALIFTLQAIATEGIEFTANCSLPFPRLHHGLAFSNIYEKSTWSMIAASVLGYVAMLSLTTYIWKSSLVRMLQGDKIFCKPLYCGILLDQSMLLNRIRDDESTANEKDVKSDGSIPFVYMCATMWHETENEMIQIMKSLLREITIIKPVTFGSKEKERIHKMNQCARRQLPKLTHEKDPDFYEFEAHIFFDDAFEDNPQEARVANKYVKQFIEVVEKAVGTMYGTKLRLRSPITRSTPYGGRLTWRMPGRNLLVAHLKDKAKIRHRKRWSQVMYMYYFLTQRLLKKIEEEHGDNVRYDQKERKEKLDKGVVNGSNKKACQQSTSVREIFTQTEEQKRRAEAFERKSQNRIKNTFLLALDGDVDFQPSALKLLIDRMKRNENVGAACGRIHPIGDGPMVWYQKFEYAISHWLQKATEHVIGCVLCSPGCFSLFRAKALMEDNVAKRYTTPPSEARHYVQYDQGEDRWLCTLLLQMGYKVEYCAASDALTYAPEGFYEFYNQRRRWTPSTMANILDLLLDYKNVTRRNPDISMLYIAYQVLLMVSSILTPGTIFLMIIGSMNLAYPDLTLYASLLINLIPIVIFVLLIFFAKADTQLAFAGLLSILYSLLMMLVLVGLIKQAVENTFCSITTVFVCFVAGVFVIAAFLHPQEFWCLIHGFLYFLAIPSMSMLLMIYSLGNLHIVSWGTRESAPPAAKKAVKKPKIPSSRWNIVRKKMLKSRRHLPDASRQSTRPRQDEKDKRQEYSFSFGNLFKCIFCPKEPTQDDEPDAMDTESDDNVVEKRDSEPSTDEEKEGHQKPVETTVEDKKESMWVKSLGLKRTRGGDFEEQKFWEGLIEKYLKPIEENKEQQEQLQKDLIQLRNKVCLFFLLANALFVTIVFSLQQVNSSENGNLSIKLPCADDNFGEAIEPISISFTVVFGLLLFLQFICMILHRITTFMHICSTVKMRIFKASEEKLKKRDSGELDIPCDQLIEFIRYLQVPYQDEGLSRSDEGEGRRKSKKYKSLEDAFEDNVEKLRVYEESQTSLNKSSSSETTDARLQNIPAQCKGIITRINKNKSLRETFKVAMMQVQVANLLQRQTTTNNNNTPEKDNTDDDECTIVKELTETGTRTKIDIHRVRDEVEHADQNKTNSGVDDVHVINEDGGNDIL